MDSNHSYSLVIADTKKDFDGVVDVTDPFYDRDVWCRINDVKLAPGPYVCIAERIQYNESYYTGKKKKRLVTYRENRICKAAVINASLCPELVELGIGEFERDFPSPDSFGLPVQTLGEAGVDTGRLGFFHNKPDDLNDDGLGDVYVIDCGFAVSSGFGDGTYKVLGLADPEDPGQWEALFVNFF